MYRKISILAGLLLCLSFNLVWAEDDINYDNDDRIFSEVYRGGKKDRRYYFIGINGGYHQHSLETFRTGAKYTNNNPSDFIAKIGNIDGATAEGEVYTGMRKNSDAILFGLGCFTPIKTDILYDNGSKGISSINAYYISFTYHYYLNSIADFSEGLISPYIGGGVSWYGVSWEVDSRYDNFKTYKDTIGYHLVGGFEKRFDKNFSVNIRGGYRWASVTDFVASQNWSTCTRYVEYYGLGNDKVKIDLDGLILTVGISYNWK